MILTIGVSHLCFKDLLTLYSLRFQTHLQDNDSPLRYLSRDSSLSSVLKFTPEMPSEDLYLFTPTREDHYHQELWISTLNPRG